MENGKIVKSNAGSLKRLTKLTNLDRIRKKIDGHLGGSVG